MEYTEFKVNFTAGWADMDFNSHMRNTAYLDKSADVRMMFFAQNGFAARTFKELNFGPVVLKDEIEYFREINLLEEMVVNIKIAGLSDNGARFILQNEFHKTDNIIAARVTSSGGWIHLLKRKMIVPPKALLNVVKHLPKTPGFKQLPSIMG